MTDITQKLERWAKWRVHQASFDIGWPKKTVTGKILDGMPSTKCVPCNGKGRVSGHKVGALVAFLECPVCAGAGKIKADPHGVKINPAFINSTIPHGYSGDPTSENIDKIICGWRQVDKTIKYYFVVFLEYTRNGTQMEKARKIGISQAYFSKTLVTAQDMLTDELMLKNRNNNSNISLV